MSSSTQRLRWLGACYALGLFVVAAHLAVVMLVQHEDWLVRSYRNRWTFRDVPSVRGALLDRCGRVLVRDEPTFELECVYEQFRLQHPVGAAVHGGTLASRRRGGEVRYSYLGDTLGPEAAAEELLSLPVGALLHSDLQKDERRELMHAALTLLAALAERTPLRVLRELRGCDAAAGARSIGTALPGCDLEMLLAQFHGVLSRLRELDAALVRVEAARARGVADEVDDEGEVEAEAASAGAGAPTTPRGLLARLERSRVDSLEGRRTRAVLADGTVREGELLDRLARPVARRLSFDLAAALRVAADDQPGLRLEPALQRLRSDALGPTLTQVLGNVAALDRTRADPAYLENRVEQALGGELEDFVPDDLSPLPEYRQELIEQAQRSYERVLRTRERRGTGGIESMLDGELAGAPGMRLVERDVRSREQLLWSSLRVEPGTDVTLSLDLDLQRLCEQRVTMALQRWQPMSPTPDRIDVAIGLVDARSGDVLALASAPAEIDGKPRLPAALSWRGTGALGSTVKPFMLLEQLTATRQGRPHADLEHLEACAKNWRGPDRHVYRCDSVHGVGGTDPVNALAESCNVFFFQLAVGLEEDGLRRAMARFGLLADPSFADGRFRPSPRELPSAMFAAPRWYGRAALPMRGIGYGLEANPLSIAAAYGALATGRLPTLGLGAGQSRPTFDLGVDPEDLDVVNRGLEACVLHGTADKIEGLQQFSVRGKTGTAEITHGVANNAWFAGYLPVVAAGGVQLAFCAVVYTVPEGVHGADAAGLLVGDVLAAMAQEPVLAARYLQTESGR